TFGVERQQVDELAERGRHLTPDEEQVRIDHFDVVGEHRLQSVLAVHARELNGLESIAKFPESYFDGHGALRSSTPSALRTEAPPAQAPSGLPSPACPAGTRVCEGCA